ncbi:aspartyl/asparaginyl beta-hydroxylase-like isoform X2 [Sycon ciliatum]|uniref:aspartyl/asparaginyl beta-hydroxylase-like isoform X2 n=1 Tax=Sycon ciliatum TaxID=27933 RepID=UPI0031F5F0CF
MAVEKKSSRGAKGPPPKGKAKSSSKSSSQSSGSGTLIAVAVLGVLVAGVVYAHQAGHLNSYVEALQQGSAPSQKSPIDAVKDEIKNADAEFQQAETEKDAKTPPTKDAASKPAKKVNPEEDKAADDKKKQEGDAAKKAKKQGSAPSQKSPIDAVKDEIKNADAEFQQAETEKDAKTPPTKDAASKPAKKVNPEEDKAADDKKKQEGDAAKKAKKQKKPVRILQASIGAKEADYEIRQEIRAADRLHTKKKYQEALTEFRRLLKGNPKCIRCKYGEGAALHELADKQRSNKLVQEAIAAYKETCTWSGGRRSVRVAGCLAMSGRMSFMGQSRQSVKLLDTVLADLSEDVKILEEIGLQCLISAMNKKAKSALTRLLELDPENGFGLGHLGFVYKLELRYEEAVPLMFAGLRGNDDRSREPRFYYHLGDALQRLNRSDEAYEVYSQGADSGNFNSMYQRSTYNAPNLKAQPWWTPEETPYAADIKRIEKHWKTIRDEGLAVMNLNQGGFDKEEENLRKEGDWGQFTLFQQGHVLEDNCRKVPKTCKIMKSIKDAAGCKRGQVKYSVMQPGTVVWPHCGPTNCRLRFHLGLVVPDDVHIRCGNDTRTWYEGKTIVFDDSFEHEVWHHGKSFRMVFIMDFWHPDLTQRQKEELSPI